MTDADTRPDGFAQPDAISPDATSPDATSPDATSREATCPEGTSPDATGPDCMNGVQLAPAANDNDAHAVPPGRWRRGQSGNPRGKRKGERHHATRVVEAMLAGDAQAITRTVITLALDGDVAALRMCLDRLAPPRRTHPITIGLPNIETAGDVDRALSALIGAMADGEVAPEQALTIAQMFELKRKTIETHDIEVRLAKLETVSPQRAAERHVK